MTTKLASTLPGYLREGWGDCSQCGLHKTRMGDPILGNGNPEARFMIIGEAPGTVEEARKAPFVGPSGELLDNVLFLLDLDREKDVWVTNTVMCRPPDLQDFEKNRAPLSEEQRACRPRLLEEVYRIDPLMIIALGPVAAKALAGPSCAMQTYRGQVVDIQIPRRDKGTLTYAMRVAWHPAKVLREMSKRTRSLPTDLPRMSTSDDILAQFVWDIVMGYSAYRLSKSHFDGTEIPEISQYVTSIL